MENKIKQILQKENLQYKNIEKSKSGFTNAVFLVDKKYVVKIIKDQTNPQKLQKEIEFYKNIKLDCIPKFVASGQYEGTIYLIVEFVQGQPIYKIWHKIDEIERENIIKKICEILKKFHSQKGDFLPEKYVCKNWLPKWKQTFDYNIELLKKRGFDTHNLQHFANTKLEKIMNNQKTCLVYNDAHFDNFLYDGKDVKIIDFDRVVYFSKDYELLIISLMAEQPWKFANEEDEQNVDEKHYKNVMSYFKQYYANMFDFEHLEQRLFIYQFFYRLGAGYEYNRNEWIAEELQKFDKFFYGE